MVRVLNKCGKRKRTEWFHTTPDGAEAQCLHLSECHERRRQMGGTLTRRTWRE